MGQKWTPPLDAESITMLEAIGKYQLIRPCTFEFLDPAGLSFPWGDITLKICVWHEFFTNEELHHLLRVWEDLRDRQSEIWEVVPYRLLSMRESLADQAEFMESLCGYVDDPAQPLDDWIKQHVKSSGITLGSVKGHISGTLDLDADWDEEHGFPLELDRWLGGEYDPIFE